MTHSRFILWLLAAGCAAPLAAQPRCAPSPRAAADAELVRYDCANGAARFSVSLPAWEIREMEAADVTLVARSEGAGIFAQAADPLFPPVTAADSARLGALAELTPGRAPTPDELRDDESVRRGLLRAMGTDSGLVALTSWIGAGAGGGAGIEVLSRTREVRTIGGVRVGYVDEVQRVDGTIWQRAGFITLHEGRLYALVVNAPQAGYLMLRPLWERVMASLEVGTEPAAGTLR
jgi:hypothetical protein